MEEELLSSTVPRALENKTKLFGFELPDLLLIFLNLSVTNLVFGASSLRYLLVWGTSLGLALVLFFAKRGKPDSYLQHLVQFHLNPSYRAAGRADREYRRFKKDQI
jgi:hypothetical protein